MCNCRERYTTFGRLETGDRFVFFVCSERRVFTKVTINRDEGDYIMGYIDGTIVNPCQEKETGVLKV